MWLLRTLKQNRKRLLGAIETFVLDTNRRIRNGLIVFSFLRVLARCGLYIAPFYLHQEGSFGRDWQDHEKCFGEYDKGLLGSKDMKEIAQIPLRKTSEQEFLRRLEEGEKCFGAKYNGKIAAFTWVSFDSCHDIMCKFKLKVNEAYLFDAYTLEPFRGKGIAPYVRFKCYQWLEALGCERLYSITLFFNTPAMRFKNKLNAKPLMLGLYIRLFRKWCLRWKIKDYH